MIRPTTTNDAGRVLRALVAIGGLTAEEVAAEVWPALRERVPPVGGDIAAWRRARAAQRERIRVHRELAEGRARKILVRLAQAGYVGPHAGHGLTAAAWRRVSDAHDAVARAGVVSDLLGADPYVVAAACALRIDLDRDGLSAPETVALGRCLRQVHECRSPSTSAERDTRSRAVHLGLVERGVRRATERGSDLVAAWVAEEAA